MELTINEETFSVDTVSSNEALRKYISNQAAAPDREVYIDLYVVRNLLVARFIV